VVKSATGSYTLAVAYDSLAAFRAAARNCTEAFEPVAAHVASHPPARNCEASYRQLQTDARSALREHPLIDSAEFDAPSDPVTAWWCSMCGGIEAPQPCIGVCIRRPAEWVNRTAYDRERDAAQADRERERRLRDLLRRVAFITPRSGQWRQTWHVLQAEARQSLATECDTPLEVVAPP
jgi:hypothetical protein